MSTTQNNMRQVPGGLFPPPTGLTGAFALDASHTRIGFSARHAMVTKVRGAFNEVEGTGYLDEAVPSNSHFEVTIRAASIDTRNAGRDAHLRDNDFLATDQYPEITFCSTSVERLGAGHYEVVGDLTIRGTTKPVHIRLELIGSIIDPWGKLRVGFEGEATMNRKEWGVSWNYVLDAGGVMVSDNVNLEFELALVMVEP